MVFILRARVCVIANAGGRTWAPPYKSFGVTMEDKKQEALGALKDALPSGKEAGSGEIPKKYCSSCERETATWAYCDQCGKFFWGRIAWDLATGGFCAFIGIGMLLKIGPEFYEKVLAVLIGAAGFWVMSRIIRQLVKAVGFRQRRGNP